MQLVVDHELGPACIARRFLLSRDYPGPLEVLVQPRKLPAVEGSE